MEKSLFRVKTRGCGVFHVIATTFDYSMQRGHGKKAYENLYAGAKAVIQEIQQAYNIAGIDTAVDRINSFIEELKQ